MIKKILLLIALLLTIAYLVIAITAFNNKPNNRVCRRVELVIRNSAEGNIISKNDIYNVLKQKGIYPVGKKTNVIQTKIIENQLKRHPLIEEAECYKTLSGNICLEIEPRLPILRIISDNGDNYYIDSKGKILQHGTNYAAHLAVVTGNVKKTFAIKELYKFGLFLKNNEFWNAQIEQINVSPEKNIELVPRIGEHIVFMGKLDHFEDKLARLELFYKKALNQVGWNKYERINIEFSNQIICTKKNN
ncbi:MAG: cell division protein FtsQ/DivIB [Bacteroides sp.]